MFASESQCSLVYPSCYVQLTAPLPEGALDNVLISMSAEGSSCDATCSKVGKKCSLQHLALLNNCDRLREHVGCEAGCEASPNQNAVIAVQSMPSYVDENAPKPQRPAMCFTAPRDVQLSCSGQAPQAKRLCACT